MGKLWRWERVGILEYHRIPWCIYEFFVGFPAVDFFQWMPVFDAFFEVLKKSQKGEKIVPKYWKYKDR